VTCLRPRAARYQSRPHPARDRPRPHPARYRAART